MDFILLSFCRLMGHFQVGTGLNMGIKLSGENQVFLSRQKSSSLIERKKNNQLLKLISTFLKSSGLQFSMCGNRLPREALGYDGNHTHRIPLKQKFISVAIPGLYPILYSHISKEFPFNVPTLLPIKYM